MRRCRWYFGTFRAIFRFKTYTRIEEWLNEIGITAYLDVLMISALVVLPIGVLAGYTQKLNPLTKIPKALVGAACSTFAARVLLLV